VFAVAIRQTGKIAQGSNHNLRWKQGNISPQVCNALLIFLLDFRLAITSSLKEGLNGQSSGSVEDIY